MYSWISRVTLASNATMRSAASAGQHHDPVREHEPVAAVGELMGEVAVPAEQRGQHREAVEGGVRGEHEDRGGEALEQEERGAVAERGEADLAERGALRLAVEADQRRLVSSAMCTCDAIASAVMPGEHRRSPGSP